MDYFYICKLLKLKSKMMQVLGQKLSIQYVALLEDEDFQVIFGFNFLRSCLEKMS